MSDYGLQRVRYYEGQTVHAEDLTAEQQYRLTMHRRHLAGLHGWGIVRGLELSLDGAGDLHIASGLAVDGYGRYLQVPQEWIVAQNVLGSPPFDGGPVDCWLLYARLPESPPLPERQIIRPGQHRRWRESAHIRLTAGGEERPDPYGTPFAHDPCRSYGPHQEPSDDPHQEWPVYLGRVQFSGGPAIDDEAERPYVKLLAAKVGPTNSQVQLQVGPPTLSSRQRFAVSLPGNSTGSWRQHLSLDSSPATRFHARTILSPWKGGPNMSPVAQAGQLHFEQPAAVPAQALPWSVYRVQLEESGRSINELRVEIALPEDAPDPSQYQLQIGSFQGSDFEPIMVVSADGSVKVKGTIHGPVSRSPVEPDLNEPDFLAAMLEQSQNGLFASAAMFQRDLAGAVKVEFKPQNAPIPGTSLAADIVLTNSSGGPVTAITLFARTVHDGRQIDYQLIDADLELLGTEVASYSLIIPIPAEIGVGELIEIEVTAMGKGPFFNIVKESQVVQMEIVPHGGLG